jgi:hypothetical protein
MKEPIAAIQVREQIRATVFHRVGYARFPSDPVPDIERVQMPRHHTPAAHSTGARQATRAIDGKSFEVTSRHTIDAVPVPER